MKGDYGTCHICCENKKLTFEHFPPRSAFNDSKVMYKGELMQRGLGKKTLCADCNNKMGSFYLHEYVRFIKLIFYSYIQDEKYEKSTYGTLEIKANTINFFLLAKACLSVICSLLPIEVVQNYNLDNLLLAKRNYLKGKVNFDILIALSTDFEGGCTFENKNLDNFGQKITLLDFWPLKILFIENSIKETENYYYNFVSLRDFLRTPTENNLNKAFSIYWNKYDFFQHLLNSSKPILFNK